MEEFKLIRPSFEYANQIVQYRQAFLDAGDTMDGCGALRKLEDPIEYIRLSLSREDAEHTPPDMVPAIQLHFIRKSDNALVGMAQIRQNANDIIRKYTGNIGYSIKPCERRKGYAKEMLKMVLAFCRDMGMEKVLICCTDTNTGSEKTIRANGGIYESTVLEPKYHVSLKRFWITL